MKKYIEILRSIDPTDTEKKLLEVNLRLSKCKLPIVKKVAAEGINDLMEYVHFRFFIQRFHTNVLII